MRACRRFFPRGGWWVVGLIGVVGWACGGGAPPEPDIPVLEMAMDLLGTGPEFTAEDSAVVERLENGDGPVRIRMVMCDEVLVDEVVSDPDELSEVMQRTTMDMFEGAEELSEELLAEVEAMDQDSIGAAWMASLEAMTPAERAEYKAEMERLMPMLDEFLQDEPDPETMEENLETLNTMYPNLQELQCEGWRRMRAELRERAGDAGETGEGRGDRGSG